MRSHNVMPMIIMLSIALFAVLGVIILGSAMSAGSAEAGVNGTESTVTESWWEISSGWFIGFAILMMILVIAAIVWIFFV